MKNSTSWVSPVSIVIGTRVLQTTDVVDDPSKSHNGVGGIMISYLTRLDMEYWGRECCGMSGATTSQYWAGFYVKNDVTFIFISTLEEEIRKMPDICLHLITPSLFHAARWIYIYGKV